MRLKGLTLFLQISQSLWIFYPSLSRHRSEYPGFISPIPLQLSHSLSLRIRVRAAEAVLDLAADAIEAALAAPDEESVAAASIAVAEAKVLTTEAALLAANRLFELAGTRSTLEELNLDRHWRNARTHTLHDPVRWKYHAIGNYQLNGVKPPRHAWL